jgi:hypothetical protein
MDQEVEDLRLERDQLAVTLELPAIGVEVEISEEDQQISPRAGRERARRARAFRSDNRAACKDKSRETRPRGSDILE